MALRSQAAGQAEQVEVFYGPSSQKPFRFANGGVPLSCSYVMIPQKLGDKTALLGFYTIDAEQVPILLGMKVLVKLDHQILGP